jgi:hypothetical protein
VRVPSLMAIGLAILSLAPAAAQTPAASAAPETFTATVQVKSASGPITASIQVHVERYTPDFDRKTMESALEHGGYANFINALRKAPAVGTVALGESQFTIRYAREQKTDKGRTLVFVTDKPVFFVGGGRADAKSRAGYESALIQLLVDGTGAGSGSMAAAARVKPGGETGVRIDNYTEEPLALLKVTRKSP